MVTNISWLKPVQDMHSDPRSAYTERLEARRQAVARQDQRHRTIGNLRLLVFLSAAVLAWLAWGRDALSAFCLALPAAVFVCLIVAHERVLRARRAAGRAVAHYARALARLDGQWSGHGETGERFLDRMHPYAADLERAARAPRRRACGGALRESAGAVGRTVERPRRNGRTIPGPHAPVCSGSGPFRPSVAVRADVYRAHAHGRGYPGALAARNRRPSGAARAAPGGSRAAPHAGLAGRFGGAGRGCAHGRASGGTGGVGRGPGGCPGAAGLAGRPRDGLRDPLSGGCFRRALGRFGMARSILRDARGRGHLHRALPPRGRPRSAGGGTTGARPGVAGEGARQAGTRTLHIGAAGGTARSAGGRRPATLGAHRQPEPADRNAG